MLMSFLDAGDPYSAGSLLRSVSRLEARKYYIIVLSHTLWRFNSRAGSVKEGAKFRSRAIIPSKS